MQLLCKDFNNPEVAGAVNPHPDYGYFYNAPTPGLRLLGINSMVCDIAVNGNQIYSQPRLGKVSGYKCKSPLLFFKPPIPLSAPKRKRAPLKKGYKATGSRKQLARAKKDAAKLILKTM
ncbi:uncharacterized protein ATNIH1004_011515 [Aspergillus tanneri]|uniref:Uncharacterized protein n=1 Tax=Aspergillus tanneri TaxID=1220188 RepID=A0A5M9MAV2_9EURO|nr:uncharacterized protein ATNIH1004_011515 [Aspergillus tanneri]KAA8642570.1 hypothetical protein ATNIH1004_011515 [Aspergillus tanneri]